MGMPKLVPLKNPKAMRFRKIKTKKNVKGPNVIRGANKAAHAAVLEWEKKKDEV
jgi:hypothetical protein